MTDIRPQFSRILLKLSGEALAGDHDMGIDANILDQITDGVIDVVNLGVQTAIVIGGGNIYRGSQLQQSGLVGRVTGDHMGMLATVMNGLALRDALQQRGARVRLMSAIPMSGVVEPYSSREATQALSDGTVCVFVAGTGNPFFTTDTAACLRGIEVGADVILKATKVDGVYDSDPAKNPDAQKYDTLTLDEAVDRQLGVMDLTALCLSRDHHMPIHVFNMNKRGALRAVVMGEREGTRVDSRATS